MRTGIGVPHSFVGYYFATSLLTISAMIPGIIYEGGKKWSKILGDGIITTKEKGFVFYLLNLTLIASLVLLFGLFLN